MMGSIKWWLKPAAWGFYFIIVFEILFMVSPLALHFYSAYGPVLDLLHGSPATAWLTRFFLPHFSETTSPLLNSLRGVAFSLILAGTLFFLAAAVPLYGSKLLRRGAVTSWLYRRIRHPQYVALAILGLGTTLLWPRFLVLLTYVTMLFLYFFLARWEEEFCLRRFGETYRAYLGKTGMFLPRALERNLPRLLPARGLARPVAALGLYAFLLAVTVAGGRVLADYSLSTVSSFYRDDLAVISPARLEAEVLQEAFRLAREDSRVVEALEKRGGEKLIVYVIPEEWRLPDLPLDPASRPGGHWTPGTFDRSRLKLLFTRPRSHAPRAAGPEIVRTAHGRDSVLLVRVDLSRGEVTGLHRPPAHVRWGDIPTPMF